MSKKKLKVKSKSTKRPRPTKAGKKAKAKKGIVVKLPELAPTPPKGFPIVEGIHSIDELDFARKGPAPKYHDLFEQAGKLDIGQAITLAPGNGETVKQLIARVDNSLRRYKGRQPTPTSILRALRLKGDRVMIGHYALEGAGAEGKKKARAK